MIHSSLSCHSFTGFLRSYRKHIVQYRVCPEGLLNFKVAHIFSANHSRSFLERHRFLWLSLSVSFAEFDSSVSSLPPFCHFVSSKQNTSPWGKATGTCRWVDWELTFLLWSQRNTTTWKPKCLRNTHCAYLRMNGPKLEFATKYGQKYWASRTASCTPKLTLTPTYCRYETSQTRCSLLLPKL